MKAFLATVGVIVGIPVGVFLALMVWFFLMDVIT